MAVSNNITAVLNFIASMCSIPIISAGIWLASKQDNECIRWLRFPVVFIGVLFLLVTLAGFVGAYWNKQGLLAFFLFAMAFLIVTVLILLVLALDNAAMSTLATKHPLSVIKNALSLHVLLDYYDNKKLHDISDGTVLSTLAVIYGEAATVGGIVTETLHTRLDSHFYH